VGEVTWSPTPGEITGYAAEPGSWTAVNEYAESTVLGHDPARIYEVWGRRTGNVREPGAGRETEFFLNFKPNDLVLLAGFTPSRLSSHRDATLFSTLLSYNIMINLADLILQHVPLPSIPSYLSSYHPNVTPLSTWTHVLAALVFYLVLIFSLQDFMKKRQPLQLNFLFQLHNIVLSVGSGILLVLMVEEVAPIVWKHGIFYGVCNQSAWTTVRPLSLAIVFFIAQ
jgi:hypothetical protein